MPMSVSSAQPQVISQVDAPKASAVQKSNAQDVQLGDAMDPPSKSTFADKVSKKFDSFCARISDIKEKIVNFFSSNKPRETTLITDATKQEYTAFLQDIAGKKEALATLGDKEYPFTEQFGRDLMRQKMTVAMENNTQEPIADLNTDVGAFFDATQVLTSLCGDPETVAFVSQIMNQSVQKFFVRSFMTADQTPLMFDDKPVTILAMLDQKTHFNLEPLGNGNFNLSLTFEAKPQMVDRGDEAGTTNEGDLSGSLEVNLNIHLDVAEKKPSVDSYKIDFALGDRATS